MVTREENLLGILSRNDVTFFIPPYQRNYEWDFEQCDVFFRDIRKTYELNLKNKNRNANNSAKHFIGSITYFPTEGNSTFVPKELVLIDDKLRSGKSTRETRLLAVWKNQAVRLSERDNRNEIRGGKR